MSFQAKNEEVLERQLKVERLSIDFTLTHNSTPASVITLNDEPAILFIQTQGVNNIAAQLPGENWPGLPAGSPTLGLASSFAVLASSTVTNTGSSVITGDLGLSPGTSVTGFPPGSVVGNNHITDGVAAAAQLAALAAYTDLSTRSSTTIASALDGQTLTAGVYSFGSGAATLATSAPATLTFSGSATDVFVIHTASTLTVGAGGAATIAFTGGASAANVYWAIGSSATIGNAGTSFAGTIIAQASITFNTGAAFNGRAIALTGAVTLANNAGTLVGQPGPTTQYTSVAPNDILGNMNLLIRVNEPVTKVCNAKLISRLTGVEYKCFLGSATGIASNGYEILLAVNSGVDFATTDFEGAITCEYTTHQ